MPLERDLSMRSLYLCLVINGWRARPLRLIVLYTRWSAAALANAFEVSMTLGMVDLEEAARREIISVRINFGRSNSLVDRCF